MRFHASLPLTLLGMCVALADDPPASSHSSGQDRERSDASVMEKLRADEMVSARVVASLAECSIIKSDDINSQHVSLSRPETVSSTPTMTSRPLVAPTWTDFFVQKAFPYSVGGVNTCFLAMCDSLTSWPHLTSADVIGSRMQETMATCARRRGVEAQWRWYGWAAFELIAAVAALVVTIASGLLLALVTCALLLGAWCLSFCIVVCELNAALFSANCCLATALHLLQLATHSAHRCDVSDELEQCWFAGEAMDSDRCLFTADDRRTGEHDEVDFSSKISEYSF